MEHLLQQQQQQQQQHQQHAVEELPLEDYEATMKLNLLEIQLALVIKEAVEASPRLTNLTDFEYVQYALTHPVTQQPSVNNPVSIILEHIAGMQAFREEYGIQETAEEGNQLTHQFCHDQPGLFLSLQYLPSSGNCIAVNDLRAFLPGNIKTREQVRNFMGAFYYRFHSVCPHFHAIRQGMSNLLECEGASSKNFDWKLHQRLIHELYICYPKRHKESFYLNSPMVINTVFALWKPYMSQNMKESIHLGHRINGFDGHRIDELFKVPDEETSRQHAIDQVQRLLLVRYTNQAKFRLPNNVTAASLWRHLLQPGLMLQLWVPPADQ